MACLSRFYFNFIASLTHKNSTITNVTLQSPLYFHRETVFLLCVKHKRRSKLSAHTHTTSNGHAAGHWQLMGR